MHVTEYGVPSHTLHMRNTQSSSPKYAFADSCSFGRCLRLCVIAQRRSSLFLCGFHASQHALLVFSRQKSPLHGFSGSIQNAAQLFNGCFLVRPHADICHEFRCIAGWGSRQRVQHSPKPTGQTPLTGHNAKGPSKSSPLRCCGRSGVAPR